MAPAEVLKCQSQRVPLGNKGGLKSSAKRKNKASPRKTPPSSNCRKWEKRLLNNTIRAGAKIINPASDEKAFQGSTIRWSKSVSKYRGPPSANRVEFIIKQVFWGKQQKMWIVSQPHSLFLNFLSGTYF